MWLILEVSSTVRIGTGHVLAFNLLGGGMTARGVKVLHGRKHHALCKCCCFGFSVGRTLLDLISGTSECSYTWQLLGLTSTIQCGRVTRGKSGSGNDRTGDLEMSGARAGSADADNVNNLRLQWQGQQTREIVPYTRHGFRCCLN